MFDFSKRNTDGVGPLIWAPMSEYNLFSYDLEKLSTKVLS